MSARFLEYLGFCVRGWDSLPSNAVCCSHGQEVLGFNDHFNDHFLCSKLAVIHFFSLILTAVASTGFGAHSPT